MSYIYVYMKETARYKCQDLVNNDIDNKKRDRN